jgi:hypothetical protein
MRRYFATGLASLMVVAASGCSGEAKDDRDGREDPAYTLLLDDDSDPDQVRGAPGAYALTARGNGEPPLAVVDLPEGYQNFGFFALVDEALDTESGPSFYAVNYWTVHGVYENPCTTAGGAPPAGTSVEDLADALGAQKLSAASAPVPISLGGHEGLFLELKVPPNIDPDTCERDAYFVWEGLPGDAHHVLNDPGAIERLWILDVGGSRVVLAAITTPGVTKAKARELQEVIESVRFVAAQ